MGWMILPFRRYLDFQGRSRRLEFWMFQLLNFIIAAVLAGPAFVLIVGASMAAGSTATPDADLNAAAAEALFESGGSFAVIGLVVYGVYALAALIPSIAVTVRRLHDRDMSGWWYPGLTLAGLIPFVGLLASLALLVLFFLPGTPGPNRFGPDPKNPYSEDVFA